MLDKHGAVAVALILQRENFFVGFKIMPLKRAVNGFDKARGFAVFFLFGRDKRSQIERERNQSLLFWFEAFHQGFARVSVAVNHGQRAAFER